MAPSGGIHYVIGFEFVVMPPGIGGESNVKFGVTRQKQTSSWIVSNSQLSQTEPPTLFPFANNASNADLANDERYTGSRQNMPVHDHVYSIDGPGQKSTSIDPRIQQIILWYNFYEFVRVCFDGNQPSGNTIVGSRCSDKQAWHMRMWLLQADGVFIMRSDEANDVNLGLVNFGGAPTP